MGLTLEECERLGIAHEHPDHPSRKGRAAPTPPGRWVVVIDGHHPTRLNRLIGCHWAAAARLKKADRARVWKAVREAQVAVPARGKRRVTLRITLAPRQRGADPDAFWKSLLDALVAAKALTDDNRQGVELMPVEYDRGERKRTTIVIEDMEVANG